ncbi:hypothetical protein HDG37_007205 [Paraburkholderia sp. MM5384-R2]|nr:hypothetical protein [Paraburkholderia sp. MM5384-R2]
MSSHPFAESFDLEAAFADVSDHWSPKVVAQVDDQYVKVAKVRGRLVWHDHEHEELAEEHEHPDIETLLDEAIRDAGDVGIVWPRCRFERAWRLRSSRR